MSRKTEIGKSWENMGRRRHTWWGEAPERLRMGAGQPDGELLLVNNA